MTNAHVMESKSVVREIIHNLGSAGRRANKRQPHAERRISVTNPLSICDLLSLAPITSIGQIFSIFISHSCMAAAAVVMEPFLWRAKQEARRRWCHLICSHYPNTILRDIHLISPSFLLAARDQDVLYLCFQVEGRKCLREAHGE